jgi:uncharacterized membrane protein
MSDAPRPTPAVEANLRAIAAWEQQALHNRSSAERLSEWITATASSGVVLVAHVAWFAGWILANVGVIPGVEPFDPFPFPFLTMTVSLEAIFLALFVLASQNRLARQADKRAHLDLQIDLLAEREMTAVLKLLRDLTTHLNVKTSEPLEEILDLAKETDIHEITDKVDELEGDEAPAQDAANAPSAVAASREPRA